MRWFNFWIFLCIPIFDANCFIVPDEIPTALSVIYSNIPKIKLGSDSRIGWGFRFGDRADAQILLELGPQHYTQPLANQQPFDNPNYPELSSSLDTEDYDIAQDPSENSLAEEVENEEKKEESDDSSENKIEEVSDELVIKTEIETMDNLLSKLTEKAENISNIDHSELSNKASKVINNLMHMLDEKITEEKAKLKNLEVMTKLQFEKNEPLTEKSELKGLISKLKNYMNKTTETEDNDTDALTTVEIGTLKQLIKRLGNIENIQMEKQEKNDNPDIPVERNLKKVVETTSANNDENIYDISKTEDNILEKIEEKLKNSIENSTRSSQQRVPLEFDYSYIANTKESSENKIEIMNTHNQILKMVDNILEKTEEKLKNLDRNSTVKDKHNNELIQTENIFDDTSNNFELNSWKIGSLKPKSEFTETGNSEKREKISVEGNKAIIIEAKSAKDRKTNMIKDNTRNEKEEEAKTEITPVILKSEKNNVTQNGTSIATTDINIHNRQLFPETIHDQKGDNIYTMNITTPTEIKSKEIKKMGDIVEKGEKNKDDTIEAETLNEEVKNGESTPVYADSELEENRSENTSTNNINSFEIVTKSERLNEQETTKMQIDEEYIEEKSQQTPTNLSNETLVNTIENSTLNKTKDSEEKSNLVDISLLTTQTEMNTMNSNESSISPHGKDHKKPIIPRIIQERNDTSIYEFNTTTIKSELTNISQTGNIVMNQNKNTDDDDVLENFVEAGKKEEFTTRGEINEEKYASKVPGNVQSNESKVQASEAPVNIVNDSTKNDTTKSKGEHDIQNVREINQKEFTMEALTKIYLESIKSDEKSEKSTSHHNSTKVENKSQIMNENIKDLETPQAQIAKYNAIKESNVQKTSIEKSKEELVNAINEKDTSSETPKVEKQTKKFNESTSVISNKNSDSRQIITEIISEPNNDFYALNKTAATIMKFEEINKIRNSATKTDKNIIDDKILNKLIGKVNKEEIIKTNKVSENYDSNKLYADTIKPQRNKQYKKQWERSLEMSRKEENTESQVHTNSTNEALDNIINRIKILDGTIKELKIKLNDQLKHWNENSESSQILFAKNLKILKILKEEKEKKITEITNKEWKTENADNIDIILEGPYKGVKMKSFKMLSLLWNKNYTNDSSKEIINKENKTSQEGKLENIITDINSTKEGDEKIFNSFSVNMVNYEGSTTENKTDIEYLHKSQTNEEGTGINAKNESLPMDKSKNKMIILIDKQSNTKLNQDEIEAMNMKKANTTNVIIQKNEKYNISNDSKITRKLTKTDENMKMNTHNGSVDEEYMMTMIAMNRAQERNRKNLTQQLAEENKAKSLMKSQQDNYIDEEYKNTMFVMNKAIKGQNMVNNTLKVIKSTITEGKTDLMKLLIPRNVNSNKKNNGEESGKPLNKAMKFNSSNKVVDEEYKMTMMAMNSAQRNYENNFLKKPALYPKSVEEERKRDNLHFCKGILQPIIEMKKGSKYSARIPSTSPYLMTSLQRKESPKTIGGRMMAYLSRILQGANKKIQVNNRRLK